MKILNYNEYVNEGFLSKTINRAKSGDIRKEQGIKVTTPKGVFILGDRGCGIPYKLDGDSYFITMKINNEERCIFGYENEGDYTYFIDVEEEYFDDTLLELCSSQFDMSQDNKFTLVKAMMEEVGLSDEDEMKFVRWKNRFVCESDRYEYEIYVDYNDVEQTAIENMRDLVGDCGVDKKSFERWYDYFGDDFLDVEHIEKVMRESQEYYVDDIESESGVMDNRLFDELKDAGLIDDTDEYFETDEEGELDYESPLFDVDEKKSDYVDKLCDDMDDPIWWMKMNFGMEELSEYINFDRLAELIVDADGAAQSLGFSHEWDYNKDGVEYYIFKE
ncbi:MAG: hypothetical protein NC548_21375 [Lachnospiraceae bacterium]|nr:hypothetical protein [Lachnospiraceae bacterium]